jgi:hypothetical protein
LQPPGFPVKKRSVFRLSFREKSKNEATDFYPESTIFGVKQKIFDLLIVSRSQKFAVLPSGGRSDQDNRLILKEPPKGGTANFYKFSIC